MPRERVSTTVDAERLAAARRLVGGTDAALFDRALNALLRDAEAEHEREVLRRLPYEADPDLGAQAARGPSLPYDGPVPAELRALAARRRARP